MALTRVNSKLLGGSFSVDSSGGLNIDSNTLVVDAGNNRVGIVTASPTVALDVTGALKTSTDSTINGLTVGKGGGSVATNTAVGASALGANTSGLANAGLGNSALFTNTSGQQNTAVGHQSSYGNKIGRAHV